MQNSCPECGYPITDQTACPECGCPIPQTQDPPCDDFNEDERYSPFDPDGWFFSLPNPISNYPKRGDFAEAHPFYGWLFQAWHITYKGNGNKSTIDALNNLLLLFNLQWKLVLFPSIYAFFKLVWWIVALLAISLLLPGFLEITNASEDTCEAVMKTCMVIGIVGGIILFVLGGILYYCGFAESCRRYWPSIYETFMRLCKRFGISMAKSIKANNINE